MVLKRPHPPQESDRARKKRRMIGHHPLPPGVQFFEATQEQRQSWTRPEFLASLDRSRTKEVDIALSDAKFKQLLWNRLMSGRVHKAKPVMSCDQQQSTASATSGTSTTLTTSDNDDDCWFYLSEKVIQLGVQKVLVTVHRVVWTMFHGLIPEGLGVRHSHGGAKPCFQLRHLLGVGDERENAKDKVAQGTLVFGERVHGSKATTDQIEDFIVALVAGGESARTAKRELSQALSKTSIDNIVYGRTWKHVWQALSRSDRIPKDSVPARAWHLGTRDRVRNADKSGTAARHDSHDDDSDSDSANGQAEECKPAKKQWTPEQYAAAYKSKWERFILPKTEQQPAPFLFLPPCSLFTGKTPAVKMPFRKHGKTSVHQIAWEYFHNGARPLPNGNDPTKQIAHLCGRHLCVRGEHLFRCSGSLNQQMRWFHGTTSRPVQGSITVELAWRLLWDDSAKHTDVCEKFGLSYHAVSKLRTSKTFPWLSEYISRLCLQQRQAGSRQDAALPFPGTAELFRTFLIENGAWPTGVSSLGADEKALSIPSVVTSGDTDKSETQFLQHCRGNADFERLCYSNVYRGVNTLVIKASDLLQLYRDFAGKPSYTGNKFTRAISWKAAMVSRGGTPTRAYFVDWENITAKKKNRKAAAASADLAADR